MLIIIIDSVYFNGTKEENLDNVYERVRNDNKDTFCFALEIKEFNITTDQYDIEVGWLRNNLPDTNRKPYDLQVRTPDYLSWNKYKNNGFMGIY